MESLATEEFRRDRRELLEGFAGLFAVGMLLYAALWLNARANMSKFMGELREKMKGALGRGSVAGLFAISFTSALRESQDIADQKHFAERIDTSLRAAEDLLDGLLDITRLDANQLQPEIRVFDVGELLGELAAQYAPAARQRMGGPAGAPAGAAAWARRPPGPRTAGRPPGPPPPR